MALTFSLPAQGEEKTSAPPSGGSASKAGPAKQTTSVRQLIELLGDDRFSVRNQASDELKSLGRAAIGPLTDAVAEDDPEIRTRALQLLVEMRGRGFMGVQLDEYWDGAPMLRAFFGQQQQVDEGEDPAPEAAPEDRPEGKAEAKSKGKAERFPAPPEVVAVQVQVGMNRPSERAGIKDGDKFISVDGKPVVGIQDLFRAVIQAGPAKKTMLVVEREGKKFALEIDLMCNPEDHPKVDLMSEAPSTDKSAETASGRRGVPVEEPGAEPQEPEILKK